MQSQGSKDANFFKTSVWEGSTSFHQLKTVNYPIWNLTDELRKIGCDPCTESATFAIKRVWSSSRNVASSGLTPRVKPHTGKKTKIFDDDDDRHPLEEGQSVAPHNNSKEKPFTQKAKECLTKLSLIKARLFFEKRQKRLGKGIICS